MKAIKFLALLLATVMVLLCFAACGEEDIPEEKEEREENLLFKEGLLAVPAEKDGETLWGYIDTTGKFVIEPQFKEALNFTANGLACVRVNEETEEEYDEYGSVTITYKCGYIDKTGAFVIEPKFDTLADFNEDGLACVGVFDRNTPEDRKYGYIDQTGAWVIEPEFAELGDFSENGLARVGVWQYNKEENVWYDRKYGYIDKTGNVVIEPQFAEASDFYPSGFAQVAVTFDETGYHYQYIDKAGTILPFDLVSMSIDHDRVLVSIDDKDGYIDKTGALVIEPQFTQAFDFSNGRAVVLTGHKFGFIDTSGAVVIEPQFDNIYGCYDGLFMVQVADKWGYINQEGDFIIEPQFDGACDFYNGLAPVQVGDKFGYIDKTGDWVIKPQFEFDTSRFPIRNALLMYARGFFADNGLACIDINGNYGSGQESKYGYIDKTGAWVIEPQFDSAESFFGNGLARVSMGDKHGVIDETGTFLIEWTNDPDLRTSCLLYDDGVYISTRNRGRTIHVGVYDLSGSLIYEYNSNNF